MRPILSSALVSTLLLLVAPACSRQSPAPAAPAAAAAETAAKLAERTALFGPEAAAPDIKWSASGLGLRMLNAGTPPRPGIGAPVRITYLGRLKDGTVFDHPAKPVDFQIGATIPGLSTALQLLGTGGKAVVYIPPSLGYGSRKVMGIPPNSGLIFEVEVVAINP